MSRHVPALLWMLPIVVEFDGFASGVADKSIDQRVLPLARCSWSHGWMLVLRQLDARGHMAGWLWPRGWLAVLRRLQVYLGWSPMV